MSTATVMQLPGAGRVTTTLDEAVQRFLRRDRFEAKTVAAYSETLAPLVAVIGGTSIACEWAEAVQAAIAPPAQQRPRLL